MSTGGARLVDGLARFDDVGYRLYRRTFDRRDGLVDPVERALARAAIAEPVEMFVARALSVGLAVGALCWLLGFCAGLFLWSWPAGPRPLLGQGAWLLAASALVGTGAGASTVAAFLARPYLVADRRRREIDALLPDAVAYMYALSTGGLNQLEIIESMARAEDTYGEVSREFQRIVRETEYFDTDYRSAIRKQALATPSEGLGEFLADLLSILRSGGSIEEFLDDEKEKHMRAAKHRQEDTLDTLELLGELYIALSLFPLLLIIVLVIMGLMGNGRMGLLYATVYGMIPIGGLAFLVMVSIVKQDDPGNGLIDLEPSTVVGPDDPAGTPGVGDRIPADHSTGDRAPRRPATSAILDRIAGRERLFTALGRLRRPHAYFRANPVATLWVTVPATVAVLAYGVLVGAVPTSWAAVARRPIPGTVAYLYLPIFANALPLAAFHEWDRRSRRPITRKLSDTLRKLSSANDTGLTLVESLSTVAETSSGGLADEFDVVCSKVRYGTSLREALIEFNNAYAVPRLARTVKLITKAQEASSQITNVLRTAAQASEYQDDLARQRRSRTRMQVVVIVMTFFTMLAVMVVLKTQFLAVMVDAMAAGGRPVGVGSSLASGVDLAVLSLLLFHAVTLQAVLSGFICGYIREADLRSGLKYVVALSAAALAVWVVFA